MKLMRLMKIDSVVVARNWREAKMTFDDATRKRKDDIKKATTYPLCITWKEGTRTHYITRGFYDKWKLGRTYRLVGSEKIYRNGIEVKKMKIEEAIEWLYDLKHYIKYDEQAEALCMAIEALEKQIPKVEYRGNCNDN